MACTEAFALAHYGIVAALADRLGVVAFLNRHLPGEELSPISPGRVAKALLLRAPVFSGAVPAFFDEGFDALPLGRLLDVGGHRLLLTGAHIGSLLDALGCCGVSGLYGRFVEECLAPFLPRRCSLWEDELLVTVWSGPGASGVPDLLSFGEDGVGSSVKRRFALHTVTVSGGFPLWMGVRPGGVASVRSGGAREKVRELLEGLGREAEDGTPEEDPLLPGRSWIFGAGALERHRAVEGALFLETVARGMYALGEAELREKLAGEDLFSGVPEGGPPCRSFSAILRLFSRATLLRSGEEEDPPEEIMNLTEIHGRILSLLGEPFRRYYDVPRSAEATKTAPRGGVASAKSRELFRQLFERSLGMALLVDPHSWQILDANAAAQAFFGYRRDEITARKFSDMVALPPSQYDEDLTRASGSHVLLSAFPQRIKNGRVRFVDVFLGPMAPEEGAALFAMLHDISDRVAAEQRVKSTTSTLETLLDAMTDQIFFKDAVGRYVMVNTAFLDFAKKSRSDVVDHTPREVLSPAEARFSEEGDLQALTTRGPVRLEHEIFAPDGPSTTVEMVKIPLYQEDQSLWGILGVIRDITEHKRAEIRLRRLLHEKEALWQEVHHRVKNNLQVMASLLAIQARALPPGDAEEVLRKSQARIESMALLHEKVYSSGAFEGVDFAAYVQDLVHVVLQSVPEEAHPLVRFDLNISDVVLELSLAVPCALVLNELMSNALRHAFSGRKEGRVAVICRQEHSAEGSVAVLEVWDDGVGMGENPSPGMGLSLVSLLVRQLGGVMETAHEGGTRVRIRFPLPGEGESDEAAMPWAP